MRYWRVKAKNPLGWGEFTYWRKFRTSTTGANWEQKNKYGFRLEQNYPNPFNPVKVISYQLKVKSEVTIKIYDILGKEVAALLNNEELEAGEHTMQSDASGLESGIYFVRLTVAQNSISRYMETKKIVLVK